MFVDQFTQYPMVSLTVDVEVIKGTLTLPKGPLHGDKWFAARTSCVGVPNDFLIQQIKELAIRKKQWPYLWFSSNGNATIVDKLPSRFNEVLSLSTFPSPNVTYAKDSLGHSLAQIITNIQEFRRSKRSVDHDGTKMSRYIFELSYYYYSNYVRNIFPQF